MAATHGRKSVFKVDNASDTLTDIGDMLNETSTSQEVETAETTAFGDSDKTYIVGLRDGTISISGHFNASSDKVHDVLSGIFGQDAPVDFEYGPEGESSGDARATGECILTSYEVSSSVSDKVSVSAEFQISGGVTWDTYS